VHKQTNKRTDKPTDTTKIMVTWPWTNHGWRSMVKQVRYVII